MLEDKLKMGRTEEELKNKTDFFMDAKVHATKS
jgi:hypothetical protein